MNGGPSGFQNAPVTRNLVIFCAFLTVSFVARGRSTSLGFSYQDIIQRLHFFRVIASIFAFSSIPELIFGAYLLYYFRLFERQIGSNKYSVFVLFSLLVSLLLDVLALVFLKDRTTKMLASGPYGLIFASFIPFLFDIPISSQIRVFGMPFSDKSFIYMAGLQLFLSSWKRSLVPTMCGLLAGSLYRLNVFGIRRFKIILSLRDVTQQETENVYADISVISNIHVHSPEQSPKQTTQQSPHSPHETPQKNASPKKRKRTAKPSPPEAQQSEPLETNPEPQTSMTEEQIWACVEKRCHDLVIHVSSRILHMLQDTFGSRVDKLEKDMRLVESNLARTQKKLKHICHNIKKEKIKKTPSVDIPSPKAPPTIKKETPPSVHIPPTKYPPTVDIPPTIKKETPSSVDIPETNKETPSSVDIPDA